MMEPFVRLTGIAAPLMEDNIDTDIIFPARFLLITARDGLGRYAFHDRRFNADGSEQPDFILNREPWRGAQILVTGTNFGMGSSREQAVWSLLGQGIRCIIAPSFGEIFYANCFRNGVLPIIFSQDKIASLAADATEGKRMTVDLASLRLSVAGRKAITFTVGDEQRQALLNGWDETALILNGQGGAIAAFELQQRLSQPWLYQTGDAA